MRPGMGFDLQGHRGARGLFPENTLEGFRDTIALGVNTIEIDVTLSADGVVMIHHDPTINPNTTRDANGQFLVGRGPAIRSLALENLQRYDIGRLNPALEYGRQYPQQAGCDGLRIPTLTDLLNLDSRIWLNIEMKTFPPGRGPEGAEQAPPGPEVADAVLELVEHMGALDRVTIQSFDWTGVRRAAQTHPQVHRAYLTEAKTVQDSRLWWGGVTVEDFGGSVPRAIKAEGESWSAHHVALTRELIEEAHALGVSVTPWTVNDPADMDRLIGWGIDGMITDRPDLARDVMKARGMALPEARAAGQAQQPTDYLATNNKASNKLIGHSN